MRFTVDNFEDGKSESLCGITYYMRVDKLITDKEEVFLDMYIRFNALDEVKPEGSYLWTPGDYASRVNWIMSEVTKLRNILN